MTETRTRRYLALGTISAIVSVVLVPLAGLVSIYSSYQIHGDTPKVYTYLISAIGGLSVAMWIAYLLTL